jgi:predicted transcriptional regulator
MPRTPRDVTDAELAVLRTLWEVGPCTIRVVTTRLYPPGGPSCHATVQKLLERLEAKRFVRRRRAGACYAFRACVCREELIRRRLRRLAEELCDGDVRVLIESLKRGR